MRALGFSNLNGGIGCGSKGGVGWGSTTGWSRVWQYYRVE